MKPSNLDFGRSGEEFVVDHLRSNGHSIVDRNWRIREGEIDIISLDRDGLLHFVEVKTRSSLAYGHPLEAISPQKAHRLQRLALAWLAMHSALGRDYSIDVAGLTQMQNQRFHLEYAAGVL